MDTSDQARVAEAVAAYGYAILVADGYAYTVGRDPTYVVAGLHDALMAQVLERAVQGNQIFGEYDVKFVAAEAGLLEGVPSDARAVQVLWPDVYGVFPDEDNYQGAEQTLYTPA